MHWSRRPLERPDAQSGLAHRWFGENGSGEVLEWRGLQTGPLTLDAGEIDRYCRKLLGYGVERVAAAADRVLVPATGAAAQRPGVLLHSTTPELKTLDGDLEALVHGRRGGDFTTYKEARSVYLAQPGDVVVGRTLAWGAAVRALRAEERGIEAIELEDRDHYYLSHALLSSASRRRPGDGSAVDRLVDAVRRAPRLVRLYAIELEMQIFLLWLAGQSGRSDLALEANRPSVSAAWNRKSVLHPPVEDARALRLGAEADATAWLRAESPLCGVARQLGLDVPRLPGYTLERRDRDVDAFIAQGLEAARLLQQRHGLTLGCLKASESGDGARIYPGLDLRDVEGLGRLVREAHVHGDDYVLEAHVTYQEAEVGGQRLPTALSAHIRGGSLAPGATMQFMSGTSWKGNVLLDHDCLEQFSLAAEPYHRLRRFVEDFRVAIEERTPGLSLTGIDFAIGTVTGEAWGERVLLGVQDLNVSFTGAECLRAFLDKAEAVKNGGGHRYGVTRIHKPRPDADHAAFLRITGAFDEGPTFADTVASIPGRWAMVGITGEDPRGAIENLGKLEVALEAAGLIDRR